MLALVLLAGCKEKLPEMGDASGLDMTVTCAESADMGGKIAFSANITDSKITLSTLNVKILFGDTPVAEKTIRTKTEGNYSDEIVVPFLANIPDGEAEVVFVATNTVGGKKEIRKNVAVKRPVWETIKLRRGTLVNTMKHVSGYDYAVTAEFPQKMDATIESPDGEVVFGWNGSNVEAGVEGLIPFSGPTAGKYEVTFNTLTFEASPFTVVTINDVKAFAGEKCMEAVLALEQNSQVVIGGLNTDWSEWTIDPDFFETVSGGTYKFLPVGGQYRIGVDEAAKFLRVDKMKSATELATINEGAIWLIGGACYGKPVIWSHSWKPEQGGLCLSEIEPKKHQITFVAGTSINAKAIDIKFFHVRGWDQGEFGTTASISTDSDLLKVTDSGNIQLAEDKELEEGATYKFVLDLTSYDLASNTGAVLHLEKL